MESLDVDPRHQIVSSLTKRKIKDSVVHGNQGCDIHDLFCKHRIANDIFRKGYLSCRKGNVRVRKLLCDRPNSNVVLCNCNVVLHKGNVVLRKVNVRVRKDNVIVRKVLCENRNGFGEVR